MFLDNLKKFAQLSQSQELLDSISTVVEKNKREIVAEIRQENRTTRRKLNSIQQELDILVQRSQGNPPISQPVATVGQTDGRLATNMDSVLNRYTSFQTSATDVEYDNNFRFLIHRWYDSSSKEIGMFGAGWTVNAGVGSEFESSVISLPVEETLRQNKNGTMTLHTRGDSRNIEFELHDGRIKRLIDGYAYSLAWSISHTFVDLFDKRGRLQKRVMGTHYISFAYDSQGRLASLTDDIHRCALFEYNSQNEVSTIQGTEEKTWRYIYDVQGRLSSSLDPNGRAVQYSYNSFGLLKRKSGPDETWTEVDYFDDEKHFLKETRRSSGSVTTRAYSALSDEGRFAIDTLDRDPKQAEKKEHEELFLSRGKRGTYVARSVSTSDNHHEEGWYNESGLPVVTIQDGQQFLQEWDPRGRLLREEFPDRIRQISYDPRAGKVSRVVNRDKSGAADVLQTDYEYDLRGNLVLARNNRTKEVHLSYDAKNRILSLIDQNDERIDFGYDQAPNPIGLSSPGMGSLKLGIVALSTKSTIAMLGTDQPATRALAGYAQKVISTLGELLAPSDARFFMTP